MINYVKYITIIVLIIEHVTIIGITCSAYYHFYGLPWIDGDGKFDAKNANNTICTKDDDDNYSFNRKLFFDRYIWITLFGSLNSASLQVWLVYRDLFRFRHLLIILQWITVGAYSMLVLTLGIYLAALVAAIIAAGVVEIYVKRCDKLLATEQQQQQPQQQKSSLDRPVVVEEEHKETMDQSSSSGDTYPTELDPFSFASNQKTTNQSSSSDAAATSTYPSEHDPFSVV